MLRPGFEPESSAREAEMIGRTTLPEQVDINWSYSIHINLAKIVEFYFQENYLQILLNKTMNYINLRDFIGWL